MTNAFDFILIKDPHFMFGFRNNIRKHGWEKDIDDKITQIIAYALNNNIKHLFFTGDVFEKSRKKDWSLNQLQQNKKRLQLFKKAGIRVYSNAGNHDYFDGRESIEGTAFGEMIELDLINYIGSGQEPASFLIGDEYKDKNYVEVFGIDYHQSTDKVLDELERINSKPKYGPRMVLMHSNITDTQTKLTDFTYKQLCKYDIDIIGCGHWHLAPKNGSIQELSGTTFLNPWNLTRVTREYHVKLDEHHPQFIHGSLVKVADEWKQSFREINLETRPFSEAFNTDVINMLQELGKSNFSFFEDVELDKVDEEMDDDTKILSNIAAANKIGENSIKIAKELIS